MTGAAIVSTTLASEAEARTMARFLVEERLAACVQIVPVASIYRWQEAVEEASEVLLLCKIAGKDFRAVETAVLERHGYDVPEIVVTEIVDGHSPFLEWMAAATARGPDTKTAAPRGAAAMNSTERPGSKT